MRQNLLIDADDTLWENNIYFEQAFARFIEFLDHSSMTPDQVRVALDEIELANIKVNGYGARNFALNLCHCYERLVERNVQPDDRERIMDFAEEIIHQPVVLIEGVETTLQYLSQRHSLTLFTKGHPEEQKLKIDRSGLGVFFGHTAIVKEKDTDAYTRLVQELSIASELTWMVGNSPKSDINPALAAGLNAVFVPHDRTWHLEKTALGTGKGKLLVVDRFSDLTQHF